MAAYPRSSGLPAKSKLAAILLALFLGTLGIHRFYLGHVATGVAMLVGTLVLWPFTCGISAAVVAVWGVVDAILIATGGLGDKDGAALL
ncbi:NINE protein [bacterium]|nr:MAG: NINE protein [bacterium]